MDPRLGTALLVLIGIPALIVGYIYATELVLRLVPDRRRSLVGPWLWLLPAPLFLFAVLVWAAVLTLPRSFQGQLAGTFVGLDNYVWFFTSSDALISLRNSLMWVVLLTLFTVGLGMVVAVLVERGRSESVPKSVNFVPLAISMTAAAVIWR